MKKIILLTLIWLAATSIIKAQYDSKIGKDVPLKDRIYAGGGFGASFGSDFGYVSISPNVGYKLTMRGSIGVGIFYRYSNYKLFNPTIKTHDYGFNLFGRYRIYDPFFFHTEYEYINFEIPSTSTDTQRDGFNSFLIGGGIAQPIGSNASFLILGLYDVTYSSTTSAYSSPWRLSIGISAGF